jgi:sulfite dehydrogenase (cytochrome) subunit B
MSIRKLSIFLLAVIVSLAGAALAQQKSIQLPADNSVSQLKPGAGVNLANLNCGICHSLDYIVRQPPMNAAQWDAEVRKMVSAYGAPISEADAKTIADYIFTAYGAQPAAPAPPAN